LLEITEIDRKDKSIIFTNGCFDILHRGHIECLRLSKSLGDILVVGLNSDRSVRSIKGEERPINNQDDRKALLCELRCVDCVIVFDEDTPEKLIEAVRPDILVKGEDWKGKTIAGANFVKSYGGKVMFLPYVDAHSTTEIIKKIKIL
jgi:rfaE bifunctional protein nucleotidyltransferase chain/domain